MRRRLSPEAAAFYASHSACSDPGDRAPLFAALPAEPRQLALIVRGLVIHRGEGAMFDHAIDERRLHHDAETRYADAILALLADRDPAPLAAERTPSERFVGTCRDFTVLFCAFLRHAGVPARARVGFADYFSPDGFGADHWVAEYWTADRGWRLGDAQAIQGWQIDFDAMDVPRDRFRVAGDVWRAYRAGEVDPNRFGVDLGPDARITGPLEIAVDVVKDLAALNKVEALPWDGWGATELPLGAAVEGDLAAVLDRAAAACADDAPLDPARRLFVNTPALRTPPVITSHTAFLGNREVALRS
ncbi:hypothetical protein BIV57_15630 [Mangrovactinospora gilvigrisea]|uniref:Transglutaminase-like domain-containing protein n=2 Tax=Mangrovactinospora gilvigrisea TaxID=1428644 RepID=A0A1J7BD30_9ACTN|nr:hypothetical protein BIV57_15630 [Mangrovactinospora gilvigrisea]